MTFFDRFLFGTCCLLKGEEPTKQTDADGDYIDEMPQSNLAAVSSYERYGSSLANTYLDKKNKYQDEFDFQMDPDMVEKYEKLNEATSYSYSTTTMQPEREIRTTTLPPMEKQPTTTTNLIDETNPTTNFYLPNLASQHYSNEIPTSILNKFLEPNLKDDLESSGSSYSEELATRIQSNQNQDSQTSTSEDSASTSSTNMDDLYTSSGVQYLSNVLRETVDSTTNREFTDTNFDEETYPTTVLYRRPTTTTERPVRVTYAKPQFRPRPTKEPNYVLVQTVSNEKMDETKATVSDHNLESIESIILMLNDSNPGPAYETEASTERISSDSTETFLSTYSDEFDTTLYTNRYRPVTRKPSRPTFTTTYQPQDFETYSPYQTKRPFPELFYTQTNPENTHSYYEPSSSALTSSQNSYYPSTSGYISMSSSKRPTRPNTGYGTAEPVVEIIKTTVGGKRPTVSASTNKIKISSSSVRPTTTTIITSSSKRPSSSSTISSSSAVTRLPSTSSSAASRPSYSSSSASTTKLTSSSSSSKRPTSTTKRVTGSSSTKIATTTSTKATKKPPSTSYVYSPYPTRRPETPTKASSTKPIPTRKVTQSQIITSSNLPEFVIQSKPLKQTRPTQTTSTNNQNFGYISSQSPGTSERPSPTVHITPKPNVNLITASNYGNYQSSGISNKVSTLPSGGIQVLYNDNPAVLFPSPSDFENEGYFGISTTVRPNSDHVVTQTSIFSINPNSKRPATIHIFGPTSPIPPNKYTQDDGFKDENVPTIPIKDSSTHVGADDLINFPPVRNPNLNLTNRIPPGMHTGVSFNEEEPLKGTTPAFVEDEILLNKMDLLVSKLVASLQVNFDTLGDMVYERRNVSIYRDPPEEGTTLRPIRKTTTKRSTTTTKITTSTRRPLRTSTKKPGGTSKKPTGSSKKPTTKRPATKVTTRITTKATRRPVTSTAATLDDDEYEESSSEENIQDNETEPEEQLPSFGNAKIRELTLFNILILI